MGLFDDVFKPATIYEMLFFDIKSALIYPTLEELEAADKVMYNRWKEISIKYSDISVSKEYGQKMYEEKGIFYPEFNKIIGITYASLYLEKGEIKRHFKKIVNTEEAIIIETFMDILHQISSDGVKSTPNYFPILCGYNIIANDIPLIIKRFIVNRNNFEKNKTLPLILKRAMDIKPWESGVIDVLNVWKFNGFMNTSLNLMSDFLGLKKTTELESPTELSKYYWRNIKENPDKTMEYIALQSATQTNLVIQLMNELRQL